MQTPPFPLDAVRAAFPALAQADAGLPRVHLDNPAGTQVPRGVVDAISRCMLETNANLGGQFSTSRAAGEVVTEARRAMADFLGASSEREIVVGSSMTGLTFAFSRSIGRAIAAGDEIVVTRMDHDGNIAPWLEVAAERGATIRWVPFDRRTWRLEPGALADVLSDKTRVVALNYANNLTGSVNDVRALCEMIRQAGALSYVDAVQYAPHRAIDVRALGCDFLTCSAYKFFGPHVGILWGRRALLEDLHAYKARPQSGDVPDKFEMGTPQLELHAGLTAAVEYVSWLG
ncbi:MAG: cysteine desulfurase-like protein, partial [Candidatus Eremiobacteraeota bacterium]|nr:cysteine desulfurase-like protein [Candidatus Eremiobacteraeota bacterium]